MGAGFLVDGRHILTCAHVVARALDYPEFSAEPPSELVQLDFPLLARGRMLMARVVLWQRTLENWGEGDVAGLELLEDTPMGAEAVAFASARNVWGHDFRAFGFPDGQDDGIWSTGRLLGRQGGNLIQIEDTKMGSIPVLPGFSGSAVWDEQLEGVVGMVVATVVPPAAQSRRPMGIPSGTRVAFVIPQDVLLSAWPLIQPAHQEFATTPADPSSDRLQADVDPRNPYIGLRPFTANETKDFFGRETFVEDLQHEIQALSQPSSPGEQTRLLTLIGASGSGKSSVVQAGLLPRLQAEMQDWIYLPPIVPGKDPIAALVAALKPHFPDTSYKTQRENLTSDTLYGLHYLIKEIVGQRNTRVVLFIDQFEELFTLTSDEEDRQRFLDLLHVAVTEPAGPLIVLLALRADFYSHLLEHKRFYTFIAPTLHPLLPLETEELRAAIERPAAQPDVQLTFEGNLVNDLLYEVQGQAGALPLLQFTLQQLFERRRGQQLTQAAYKEIGRVRGALAKHAQTTYENLPQEQHPLARILFLRLLEPGASEQDTTRRRATLNEFTFSDPAQTRLMQATIDAFIRARLLTTSANDQTPTIEVSHEALIREWPLLADWLREARKDIPLQHKISQDATGWEQNKKSHDRLYRGGQLKEAQRWATRSPLSVSKQEQTFLSASTTNRLHSIITTIAVALFILASSSIAGWFALQQPPKANYVTNDKDDGSAGSLRWAIGGAESNSTITFDPALAGKTITLTNGDIHITQHALYIRGLYSSSTNISPLIGIRSKSWGIYIDALATVIISDLVFLNSSYTKGSNIIFNSGGLLLEDCPFHNNEINGTIIYNAGRDLFISDSNISNNTVGVGQIIYNASGYMQIIDSIISNNKSSTFGSIGNNGDLTISGSTISGNISGFNSNGGGGIFNSNNLTISGSTISDNKSLSGEGGGILSAGTLFMENSTISRNSAGVNGNDIAFYRTKHNSSLSFCTIYNDIPTKDNKSSIFLDHTDSEFVHMKATIIVGNDKNPAIVGGKITSDGYNIVQNMSTANFVSNAAHQTDLSIDDDTKIFVHAAEIQKYNDTVAIYALRPNSDNPAVDAIPQQDCNDAKGQPVITDQRGMPRPHKNRAGKEFCDIGAYEAAD